MHMRYILIEQAEPAMILARNIWGPNGQLLLTADTVLKESYISRLRDLQYSALYVKSYPDEPVENILEPVKQETMVQATLALKSVAEAAVATDRLDVDRVLEVVSDIVDQVLSNRNVVYSIADIRSFDDYTYGHSVDVCVLAVMCAAEMGMARYDLLDLGTGAVLHDLGKLFTPKAILSKETQLSAKSGTSSSAIRGMVSDAPQTGAADVGPWLSSITRGMTGPVPARADRLPDPRHRQDHRRGRYVQRHDLRQTVQKGPHAA